MDNNALIGVLESDSRDDRLQVEEGRLVRILEALREVQESSAWRSLKEEIFDNQVHILERELREESLKVDCDVSKLNRLAGQLQWATRYADLSKMDSDYRMRLNSVRKQLHGSE